MSPQFGQTVLFFAAIAFLIGGPWWLIGNAVERRRVRRARTHRLDHVEELGQQLRFELGAFSDYELLSLYVYLTNAVAVGITIDRTYLASMAADARRTSLAKMDSETEAQPEASAE